MRPLRAADVLDHVGAVAAHADELLARRTLAPVTLEQARVRAALLTRLLTAKLTRLTRVACLRVVCGSDDLVTRQLTRVVGAAQLSSADTTARRHSRH